LKKKRGQALEAGTLLHSGGKKRRVRARHGGRARGLSPAL
jgi:hypothetical protein